MDKHSSLTVIPLNRDVTLAGGHCYVGTNDLEITLTDTNGQYRVIEKEDIVSNKEKGHAFDSFLRSVADSFQGSLLVTLLSGAEIGSFEGLKHIKAIKIAQKTESCMVPGSLLKAVRKGIIDYELSTPDIAKHVWDWGTDHPIRLKSQR